MSYDQGRYNEHSRYRTLRRLGIERLPSISTESCEDLHSPFVGQLPIRMMPVPGKKCPNCLSRGQTIWVIPGKRCPQCGSEVN